MKTDIGFAIQYFKAVSMRVKVEYFEQQNLLIKLRLLYSS
jgi:hypothetical protein